MGITYCKSLFNKPKTTQNAANTSNSNDVTQLQPAADIPISTFQNAVQLQEGREGPTIATAAASIDNDDEKYVTKIVCNDSELTENAMREIDMGDDKKVLLIKQNGKISAIGAKCAHYGAPLVKGALGEGRVRCPWHGACFNIETGDIENFPGLDSIPCFQVNVNDGLVTVRAKKSDLETHRRIKQMTHKEPRNGEIFVAIGGGPSSQTCVETLRQNGFKGRILMICKEKIPPYDRVKVSKIAAKPEEIQLRDQKFYDDNQIEVSLNVEATSLDPKLKEISLSCGNKLKYDKLFIATGSRAKKPAIPGNDLKNIFTLRTLDDVHAIERKLKPSKHVVILGSSFIGMEAAAYCLGKVEKITVIGKQAAPLIDSFGEEIGNRIMQMFQNENIDFIMNSGIKSFFAINQETTLSALKLLNDHILKADVCIIGIGSELNTEFLEGSGLAINENGSIDADLHLRTNITDVFIGGDIANAPIFTNNNEPASIGHYALAQYHGKIAALNMLDIKTELKVVPYFFTLLLDKVFTFTGQGKASEIFIEGDLETLRFVAFYFDSDENVIAMSSCQPNKWIAEFAEKLAQGMRFKKNELRKLLDLLVENGKKCANELIAKVIATEKLSSLHYKEDEKLVENALTGNEKAKNSTPLPASAVATDYIETIAGYNSDFADNSMKEIDMGNDKKVLLIKQNGKFTAIGAKCSHYGAPLVMGALGEGRVRCPWHGACFNIETGDIEDFPGLDSISCFQVDVNDGLVTVRAKKSDLETDKRIMPMAVKEARNGEIFVVIGGGPSAQTCVETLRQNGFKGRILMICKENILPYDRVKVSKNFESKPEEIRLRDQKFYDDNQIEVSLNVEATSLDPKLKEISLSSGNKLKYDKLFIATGAKAKKPAIPGNDLKNIFTLRNLDDAHAIESKLKPSCHVVILGSSFIGMEAAAYCSKKVSKVTIVTRSAAPLIDSFGEAIGNRIRKLFEENNVEFVVNSGIKSFSGNNENLETVELLGGERLWADVCIVGIGSQMNTEFLEGSGLAINENGSIDADLHLRTNITDVFIGGDIANAPIFTNNNEPASIGHYALAQYHGKIAALNMLDIKTELKAVPYFFTLLLGKVFTFTGHGKVSEIFIEGDLDGLAFVAFYFDEHENIIGMASCQPDKSVAEFAEKLSQGYRFHKNDIEWVTENEYPKAD